MALREAERTRRDPEDFLALYFKIPGENSHTMAWEGLLLSVKMGHEKCAKYFYETSTAWTQKEKSLLLRLAISEDQHSLLDFIFGISEYRDIDFLIDYAEASEATQSLKYLRKVKRHSKL